MNSATQKKIILPVTIIRNLVIISLGNKPICFAILHVILNVSMQGYSII